MTSSRKTGRGTAPTAARRYIGLALGALATAAIASSVAMAAGGARVVSAASNSVLNQTVAVDTHGRTLYALHPEAARHLLCKTHACLQAWPPLTVHSPNVKLAAANGMEGHLGLLRRGNGKRQVTLRGMPLYRFSGDGMAGEANGEGIKSFGGTCVNTGCTPTKTMGKIFLHNFR